MIETIKWVNSKDWRLTMITDNKKVNRLVKLMREIDSKLERVRKHRTNYFFNTSSESEKIDDSIVKLETMNLLLEKLIDLY